MPQQKFRTQAIRSCAERFRAGIERCDRFELPYVLDAFPAGSCGVASLLLGSYLHDEGFGRFAYVIGEHQDASGWHSHVWMQQGDVVVDITADQFSDKDERVIVTRDSAWHASLRHDSDGVADFRLFDQETEQDLRPTYDVILARMPTVDSLPSAIV